MFEDYFILTSAIATATLIWRNLKEDHPIFKSRVATLPLIGEALSCGFCFAVWMSLLGVVILNPMSTWHPDPLRLGGIFAQIFLFLASWFAVAAGVLFIRSVVIVLLELGAVLKHRHQSNH